MNYEKEDFLPYGHQMISEKDIVKQDLWPTPLVGAKLDYLDNKSIEKYILDIKKNNKGRIVSNQGGWQDALDHNNPIFGDLLNSIQVTSRRFEVKPGPKKVSCQMWGNINYRGNWNNLHEHTGAFISGVYYVKVPKDSGCLILRDPRTIIKDEQSAEPDRHMTILPEEGLLFLFPGYLEHMVTPSESDESRISIAFNVYIYDDK